jgi:uncharacterized protein (DUF342 family)
MSVKVKPRVQASVDADHMKAWLRLAPDADLDLAIHPLKPDEVVAVLEASKIVVDDAVTARIDEFVEQVAASEQPPEAFLIVEGTPPVDGQPGAFVSNESSDEEESDSAGDDLAERVDYRTANMVRTVEKDAVIGKVSPPVAGTPGTDVHGKTLQPRKRLESIQLQANVRLGDDGQTVIAAEAGRVILDGYKLGIREVLEINGDVDFKSGNVDATTDVCIRGTIHDLFEVRTKKSISVGGAVQAATLVAGENVFIRGGILSRRKGRVTAKGTITAKFCDEADLRADGDIHIAKELINSRVHTGGMLRAERAAIIGGQVYARNGADVHTLGSDACAVTRVHVGVSPSFYEEARRAEVEFDKQAEAVRKIRNTVQPLLADAEHLTAEQEEEAIRLLRQARQAEARIKAGREALEAKLAVRSPEESPAVTVQGRICQKVVVAIDDRETHFHKEIKGPLRIEQRRIDNVTEFVAVNQLTGSVTTLNSTDCDLSAVSDGPESAPGAGPGAAQSASGT